MTMTADFRLRLSLRPYTRLGFIWCQSFFICYFSIRIRLPSLIKREVIWVEYFLTIFWTNYEEPNQKVKIIEFQDYRCADVYLLRRFFTHDHLIQALMKKLEDWVTASKILQFCSLTWIDLSQIILPFPLSVKVSVVKLAWVAYAIL